MHIPPTKYVDKLHMKRVLGNPSSEQLITDPFLTGQTLQISIPEELEFEKAAHHLIGNFHRDVFCSFLSTSPTCDCLVPTSKTRILDSPRIHEGALTGTDDPDPLHPSLGCGNIIYPGWSYAGSLPTLPPSVVDHCRPGFLNNTDHLQRLF